MVSYLVFILEKLKGYFLLIYSKVHISSFDLHDHVHLEDLIYLYYMLQSNVMTSHNIFSDSFLAY